MAFPVHNDFRQSLRTLRDLPLGFERNLGQASPSVRFLARGDGYFLYLDGGEFVIEFMNPADRGASGSPSMSRLSEQNPMWNLKE